MWKSSQLKKSLKIKHFLNKKNVKKAKMSNHQNCYFSVLDVFLIFVDFSKFASFKI